jgi:hypothetical protein
LLSKNHGEDLFFCSSPFSIHQMHFALSLLCHLSAL